MAIQATPWYEDKTVHAVLTFVVALVANSVGRKFGFSLNVEEIVSLATVLLGFIFAGKWKGAVVEKAAEVTKQAEAANVAAAGQVKTLADAVAVLKAATTPAP